MDPIMTIVMYIVLIIPSITVHEYAHARASNRLGDTTPRLNNRLTLNPLAHIDRIGTVILPLVLSVMGAGVVGRAKPVPINPRAYDNPAMGELFVALAGPAANIMIALLMTFILLLVGNAQGLVGGLLLSGALLNIVLAVFNMIPIPPLDGYRIIGVLVPAFRERAHTHQRIMMWIVLGVMISPLGRYVAESIFTIANHIFQGMIVVFSVFMY